MDRTTGDAAWAEALLAVVGPDRAEAARAFAASVPAGYRERVQPGDAAWDLDSILVLESGVAGHGGPSGEAGVFIESQARRGGPGGPHRIGARPSPSSLPGSFRLRRVATEPVEQSELLPLMESFGLVVVEAFPQWIDPPAGSTRPCHIDDIGVRRALDAVGAGPPVRSGRRRRPSPRRPRSRCPLQQVDNSVVALSRAVPTSAAELDAYEALIETLERGAHLDRAVEALPDVDEWPPPSGRPGRCSVPDPGGRG